MSGSAADEIWIDAVVMGIATNIASASTNRLMIILSESAGGSRQPGDLGVLEGVAEGVWEEARTRGFASPALAGFAFDEIIMNGLLRRSILGFT